MPYLIKKIEGEIFDNFVGEIVFYKKIIGAIGLEDYVIVNNFIGFTQNFSNVIEVTNIRDNGNTKYGLHSKNNVINLEISY